MDDIDLTGIIWTSPYIEFVIESHYIYHYTIINNYDSMKVK